MHYLGNESLDIMNFFGDIVKSFLNILRIYSAPHSYKCEHIKTTGFKNFFNNSVCHYYTQWCIIYF